jgi:hypothetical protein
MIGNWKLYNDVRRAQTCPEPIFRWRPKRTTIECLLLALSGHALVHCKCPLLGESGNDFLTPSRKCFGYFLLGRLPFGDNVASRRFAHLVSDGLPLM